MILSNRQRLVAEAGLLTLLGWMALTIAFAKQPRPSSASPILIDAAPRSEASTGKKSAETALELTREAPELSPPVPDIKIALPPTPMPMPSGTVIRMGEGVHEHAEPKLPSECLNRSATGKSRAGPVP